MTKSVSASVARGRTTPSIRLIRHGAHRKRRSRNAPSPRLTFAFPPPPIFGLDPRDVLFYGRVGVRRLRQRGDAPLEPQPHQRVAARARACRGLPRLNSAIFTGDWPSATAATGTARLRARARQLDQRLERAFRARARSSERVRARTRFPSAAAALARVFSSASDSEPATAASPRRASRRTERRRGTPRCRANKHANSGGGVRVRASRGELGDARARANARRRSTRCAGRRCRAGCTRARGRRGRRRQQSRRVRHRARARDGGVLVRARAAPAGSSPGARPPGRARRFRGSKSLPVNEGSRPPASTNCAA